MNTGIGDAINLGWKLAHVIRGRQGPALLDSYEPERISFARRLVATTDRAFTGLVASGALGGAVRRVLAPAWIDRGGYDRYGGRLIDTQQAAERTDGRDIDRLVAMVKARGDGRVYRIAVTATDSHGASCTGTATMGVPRHKRRPAVDSAPPSYDSLARGATH